MRATIGRQMRDLTLATLAAITFITIALPAVAQPSEGNAASVAVPPATTAPTTPVCPDPASVTGPYTEQIAKLNAIITQKDAVIASLQGDVNRKSQEVARLENEVKTRTAANNELLGNLGKANGELGQLVKKVSEKEAEIKATRLKMDAAQARARKAANEDKAAQARFQTEEDAYRNQLETIERDLAAAKGNVETKSAEAASLSAKLADASALHASAAKALEEKQLQVATKDAHMAMIVVCAVVAFPIILLALYILILRGFKREAVIKTDKEKLVTAALGLRRGQGRNDPLLEAEDWLLDDLTRNRHMLRDARDALRFTVGASIVCSFILTVAALLYLDDVSLATEKAELVKSASWQALIALFTPVASLVGIVTLAQTKYKDAVAHCISAQLCHWSGPKPPGGAAPPPAGEAELKAAAPGIDVNAAGPNPRAES